MIAAIAVLASLQSQPRVQDLSPKTRPFLEVAQFKAMPCVAVNEVWFTSEGVPNHLRVYRFTYRARFADELDKWKSTYLKAGWTMEKVDDLYVFDRPVKHPKLKDQSLLLAPGRAVFNAKRSPQVEFVKDDGYVRVSLNERFKH